MGEGGACALTCVKVGVAVLNLVDSMQRSRQVNAKSPTCRRKDTATFQD